MAIPVTTTADKTSPLVGLIGLGLIGGAVAERLLMSGFRVVGFDIALEQRARLIELGGTTVESESEVVAAADRVCLALPTDEIVSQVLSQVDSELRSGQMIVDLGTGDPRAAESLAAQLAARGVRFIDATISGSSAQVRRGEVLVMVGGAAEDFASSRDLFESFARTIRHVGPSGSGATMKLVTNLVLGLNRAALAEGLAFAEAIGLDAATVLSVLKDSMAYSRIMETKGPKMVSSDFTPEARLSQHLKDVRLIRAAAADASVDLPLSAEHQAWLERAEAQGLGPLDNSALIEVLRRGGA